MLLQIDPPSSGNVVAWTALGTSMLIATFVFGVIRWVASIARHNTLTEAKAKSADLTALQALAKVEVMGTSFHDHRVDVTREVADINARVEGAAAAVVSAESRLARSIDDLGRRFDKFVERLDRVLEQRK